MSDTFKPMLAGTLKDFSKLRFPLLASPKLDGIRCILLGGQAMSRHMKPIPNRYVQAQLKGVAEGLDGELMLDVPGSFNKVSSAIMSQDGEPDFTFWVFDRVGATHYWDRAEHAHGEIMHRRWPRVEWLQQQPCENLDQLSAFEATCVEHGFEGCMVRSIRGEYKFGRSTEKQGILLKWKRFSDAEAEIIGTEEFMHNDNEATTDALGHAKRSSAKAGKRPAGVLGALICRRSDGVEFSIGTGFTETMRDVYWAGRAQLIGQLAKYKFQPDPSAPAGAAPRFPVFLGLRHRDDL